MLSATDNEKLTGVGPGTPMGELMRRYWQPVLLSWEVAEPDCDPIRVRILGENLVAYRDTSGRVGLLSEWCPHRLTSLFLGRNEEDGLRCVYHGWKFDVNGVCVDMPNEPDEYKFNQKVKMTSYPTIEIGRGDLDVHGSGGSTRPRSRTSSSPASRRRTGTPRRSSRSAIGSRHWKAASTPSTRRSCTERSARAKGIGLDGLRAEGACGQARCRPYRLRLSLHELPRASSKRADLRAGLLLRYAARADPSKPVEKRWLLVQIHDCRPPLGAHR